jgi:hypothetical protein
LTRNAQPGEMRAQSLQSAGWRLLAHLDRFRMAECR